jgi:hypothetical protein
MAPGQVMVISTMGMPPLQTASAAMWASRSEDARITGTIPICSMRLRTCCLFNRDSSLVFAKAGAGKIQKPQGSEDSALRYRFVSPVKDTCF